jgi:hypothetical protein
MALDYPVYKFIVKEEGTNTGMVAISLVSEPALKSEWMTFKKTEIKPQFVALESEEIKNEILGAALIPDYPILRKDDDGKFYYGIFEKETIEVIRNKFMKQSKNLTTVNLNHDSEKSIDAFLNETYIIESEEQLSAVKALGLGDEIVLGTLMMRYKIENDDVYNFAKDNLNGFSIEILLEKELIEEFQKNNLNKNITIMSKINKMVEKFKTAISDFEETSELEDVTVAESGRVLRYTEIGAPVLEVTVDEEGVETTVPFEEAAELILEDGRTIIIDDNGNLLEIKDADEEVEAVTEEDLNKSEKTESKEEVLSGSTESKEEKTEVLSGSTEETTEETSDLDKTLKDLIPTDVAGTYQLEVYVDDGKITFGTLYAWTYSDLKLSGVTEQFEALKTEKKTLNTKVEELQAEIKKPVAAPVFTQFGENEGLNKKNKKDFSNNLDYTLARLGLNKE